MKTKLSLALVIASMLGAVATAQMAGQLANRAAGSAQTAANNATKPSGGGQPANPGQPGGSTVNGQQINAGPDTSAAERIFNSDRWSIDPETGTIVMGNMKFKVGDNMLVRARFERYLSTPPPEDSERAYQALLAKIDGLLSVDQPGSNETENIYQAWLLLFDAAKFDQDGGDSMIVANQVFNAWRVRSEKDVSLLTRANIDRERKRSENALKSQMTTAMSAKAGSSSSGMPKQPPNTSGGRRGGGNQSGNNAGSQNGLSNATINSDVGPSNSGLGTMISEPTNVGNFVDLPGTIDAMGNQLTPEALARQSQMIASQGLDRTKVGASEDAIFTGIDLLRTNAELGALDTQMALSGLNAQLQFQTTILFFLFGRKFEHSLIAGEFYRHIFKGSAQKVTVARNELAKFMDLRDVFPTIDTFEGVARTAIKDVSNGMRSVETTYDTGQRWQALQRLQETFVLGEYQPKVIEFDPAKRQVLGDLYRNASELQKLMEDHNFAAAQETLAKIQADASDFPSAHVRSGIMEQMQVSNLAVLSARTSILSNNIDQAREDIEKAIKIWPLNPEIPKFSESVSDRLDLGKIAQVDFDKLMEQRNYRQIFNQKNELGLALFKDQDRGPKLKAIVDRLAKVDTMIAYADEAMKQNNGFAAWEMLTNAALLEPTDPTLALAKADVAPRVANFASALDSAMRAERAGQYAQSLNYYLIAQDIYPGSQFARAGIENSGKLLIAKLNPNGSVARSVAANQIANTSLVPASSGRDVAAPGPSADAPAKTGTNGLF